jgi:hypothetical protein
VFGLWSNDVPDNEFLGILSSVFDQVDGHVIEFENPIQGKTTANGVYIAKVALERESHGHREREDACWRNV